MPGAIRYPRLHDLFRANHANKIANKCIKKLSDRQVSAMRMIMGQELPRYAPLESMVTLDLVAERLKASDLDGVRGIEPVTRQKLFDALRKHSLDFKSE
ncbi:TPA: hypothetical protein HA244_04685 [Candidatus Micrarchaeota archaeon]|nr:hypothetical protein [Candidatus Micrarchaeota archaeon]